MRPTGIIGFFVFCTVLLTSLHAIQYDKEFLVQRLKNMHNNASTSVLLHVHIPKVGGTALSIALSTECNCVGNKESMLMKKLCSDCPTVTGHHGFTKKYSYSRLTGWTFGLHVPYGKMVARTTKHRYIQNGLYPVFIILLREPFDRFISEATHLVKKNECFRDWSSKMNCMYSSHLSYRKHKPIEAFVADYAKLNLTYLIQNRETKMIGGKSDDFNMGFRFRSAVGSRWIPDDTPASIAAVGEEAINVITKSSHVLIGIHERFLEMICTLEILFGHLYRFNYNATVHSHKMKAVYDASREQTVNAHWRNTTVFTDWAERNQPDIKLYSVATQLFDAQFDAALELLRSLHAQGSSSLRAPHCESFL